MNRYDRWLLARIEHKLQSEMAKPTDDKIVRLLDKIIARLDKMENYLSPKLAMEIKETERLVLKLDRMVPDRPTKKGN